jgi:lysine 2,3-aminomutase
MNDIAVAESAPDLDPQEPPPPSAVGFDPAEARRRLYGDVSDADWSDWRWQLRNRLRDRDDLERAFVLSGSERATIDGIGGRLPVGITPYYATLMNPLDPNDPLRRTLVPLDGELVRSPGEENDPLGEDADSAVPGLVHRYPDRVLFLVSNFCAVYCRYCTRARLVGHTGEMHFSTSQHKKALEYIASHPEIRDVLISGGDPLTMSDVRLDELLGALRAIPHVEFIRIGTKVPAVLPQRITDGLCEVLRRHKPWMSVHFMHPAELTPEVALACGRIADCGVPLGSQTVLLRGTNDDVPTMKKLMHGLLKMRVRPYYLYQCDPISGSAHLRTPVSVGLEIIAGLRGHTTGYAVPTFVVDAPGGGGKIPLLPDSVVGRDGDDLLLRNFEGQVFRYPDPGGSAGAGVGGAR